MNEHDSIDSEFAALLRDERRKDERRPDAYHLQTMQPAIEALTRLLHDHIIALYDQSEDWTVEEIIRGYKPALSTEETAVVLHALMQEDIQEKSELFTGSVHMSGRGEYIQIHRDESSLLPEANPEDAVWSNDATLEDDEYIIGLLEPANIFVEHENDTMRIAAYITEATLHNAEGRIQALFEQGVLVSLGAFHFHKIIRHDTTRTSEQARPELSLNVAAILKEGGVLQEFYNDIENDLNQNEYSDEEYEAACADSTQLLKVLVGDLIKPHQRFSLTALSAVTLEGEHVMLHQQPAKYVDSLVVRFNNTWRIIHEFQVYGDDTTSRSVVHILPEDIVE